MSKFHLTNRAVGDLSDIWEYTLDAWSEQQADAYYNMLIGVCQKITENPQLFGTRYEEIAEGLRGYRANKHIISYRILPNEEVLVLRILHQRMDLKRRIHED